jgi:hypothetical protein
MDEFVDDTTGPRLFILRTIKEIAARIQIAAQWWEQLLHVTGGQLDLPKIFYYLLHWVFDFEGMLGLLHLRNWIFRSPSGKAPTIKKSMSHSVPARHLIAHLWRPRETS